jgi:hypothetical protein
MVTSRKNLYRLVVISLLACSTVLFNNCSGGLNSTSAGGQSAGNAGNSTSQNVSALEGLWFKNLCVDTNTGPVKDTFIVSTTSDQSVHFSTQLWNYSAQACSGGGSPNGTVYDMGPINFTQVLTYGGRTFFRGTWTETISGQLHQVIWGLKTPNLLCPGIDSPFLVTAEQINTVFETIQDHTCYTRL